MGDASSASDGVYMGPGSIRQPAWDSVELRDAQRKKRVLDTIYPGMSGVIVDVRDNDVVLKLQFPGVAYIKVSDLKSTPPARYGEGVRVTTPYGVGIVKQFRSAENHVDYVVELVENKLSGGKCAVGYLNPEDVKLRSRRTAMETMEDATSLRTQGNEQFKQKKFAEAQALYSASVQMLSTYDGGSLDSATRKLFLDCFLKSLGNTATSFLRQPNPDLEQAAVFMTEALNLDPADVTGNRAKNLLRRGEALFRLREYEGAITDLADPLLSANEEAQGLLKTAKDFLSKETAKSQKRWAAAFAKAAEEEDGEADASNERTVRFTSPEPAAGKAEARGQPESPRDTTPDKSASEKRKLFAGVTPFPGSKHAPRTVPDEDQDDYATTKQQYGGDETMLLDEDIDARSAGWLPWALGAGALALAGGAVYLYAKSKANR